MGNYVANTKALFEALALDEKAADTKHDMGGDIAPYFASRNEAGVHDFNSNEIPGSTATRSRLLARRRYDQAVRPMRTLDSIALCAREFNLYNQDWPIYTRRPGACRRSGAPCTAGRDLVWATPPIRIVSPGVIRLRRRMLARYSALSPNVRIHSVGTDCAVHSGAVRRCSHQPPRPRVQGDS